MRQVISTCSISIAVAISITPNTQWCNRVSKDAFGRLEPCASKDARTVLRGPGAGNRVRLPDTPFFSKRQSIPQRANIHALDCLPDGG